MATKPQRSSTDSTAQPRESRVTATSYQLGKTAEDAICDWLSQQGCQLVARNFHCRQGEIDLIMRHQDCLVFVEIRLRRGRGYANALESVTPAKQQRISRCAQFFLLRHPQWHDYGMRFDVIALDRLAGEPNWIQAAFSA